MEKKCAGTDFQDKSNLWNSSNYREIELMSHAAMGKS